MTEYGYSLVYTDQNFLAENGYGKVAHIPAIFDGRPGYAIHPSEYLIDRGLGLWEPRTRGARPAPKLPSRKSVKNYGDWLVNALEWADVRGIDLMTVEYSTLIRQYQEEMLKGLWSADGEGLSATTVNLRLGAVVDYLMWCADKGYRKPFVVPTTTKTYVVGSHRNSRSHETKTTESRAGKVKVNKRALVFPKDDDIQSWLKNVYAAPLLGKTQGLMAEHVLNTAIRREELASWRVDTLPLDTEQWVIVNPYQPEEAQRVLVTVKYGVKGTELYIDEHGDKVGPEDRLHVPLWLALKIDTYRKTEREKALRQLTKGVRDRQVFRRLIDQSVHLYLNPKTGKRYTGDQIYRFWTTAKGPDHWSPHLGRDYWACKTLLKRMEAHGYLVGEALKRISENPNLVLDQSLIYALQDTAMTTLQMEIKPQLRHVSVDTTQGYVEWLFNQLHIPLSLTKQWTMEDNDGLGDEA